MQAPDSSSRVLNAPNLNYLWATAIVEELTRQGVGLFVLASGSRCSPFTLAVAGQPGVHRIQHVDERGCGFAAVGYARATGRPAVVITTSGTAVANLLPAVMEASEDGLPLVVLSADRPARLRNTGANQTMDQVDLFGTHVRWFHDLACPNPGIPVEHVLSLVGDACRATRLDRPGPVHLNCMLDEPLQPVSGPDPVSISRDVVRWAEGEAPWNPPEASTSSSRLPEPLAATIRAARRGVLLIGRLQGECEVRAVQQLAARLGWPVLADITSGLRLGGSLPHRIACADALLSEERWLARHRPDVVVQVGRRLVSKLLQAFAAHESDTYLVVCPDSRPLDPHHAVTHRVTMNLSSFCEQVPLEGVSTDPGWTAAWEAASHDVQLSLSAWEEEQTQVNEPGIARSITRCIPAGHGLFVGNSMPVRDLDQFGVADGPSVAVAANRGVSGIDGTVLSAVGYAAGRRSPVTLLLGDLSLVHDLNGLLALARSETPITVVLVNNRGGGIFHFLPIAETAGEAFEPWFGTPHDIHFSHAAALVGLDYLSPGTMEEFRTAYAHAVQSGRSSVLEVRTDRVDNLDLHRALWKQLRNASL